MKYMTANEAKTKFGEALDNCVREPVSVSRYGREAGYLVSPEQFQEYQQLKLDKLRAEIQLGVDAYERGDFIAVEPGDSQALADDVKRRGRERLSLT